MTSMTDIDDPEMEDLDGSSVTHRASLIALARSRAQYLTDEQGDDLEATAYRGWQLDGLCAQADPEDWFPDKGHFTSATGLAMCWECPARRACLAAALLRREDGTWAGTTYTARRPLGRMLRNGAEVGEVLDHGLTLALNPHRAGSTDRAGVDEWDGAA